MCPPVRIRCGRRSAQCGHQPDRPWPTASHPRGASGVRLKAKRIHRRLATRSAFFDSKTVAFTQSGLPMSTEPRKKSRGSFRMDFARNARWASNGQGSSLIWRRRYGRPLKARQSQTPRARIRGRIVRRRWSPDSRVGGILGLVRVPLLDMRGDQNMRGDQTLGTLRSSTANRTRVGV